MQIWITTQRMTCTLYIIDIFYMITRVWAETAELSRNEDHLVHYAEGLFWI